MTIVYRSVLGKRTEDQMQVSFRQYNLLSRWNDGEEKQAGV